MHKKNARTAVPGQERASSSRFAPTKGILCTTLPTVRLVISTVVFRYSLDCFEMKVSFRTNRCRLLLNLIRLKYGLRTRNSFEIRSTLLADKQLAV